jgi:hypothetical protein
MSITFSSCFYVIKSKFDPEKYIEWMNNFISIVNKFNLVIFTDENSVKYINTNNNPKIKVIIKPFEKFFNYRYKDFWIENHHKNKLLNEKSCWELNMLWAEKIPFVKETIDKKYFDSKFYGWCDIGYFRNRSGEIIDTNTRELINWPNLDKIKTLNKNKIIYACVNNNDNYIHDLANIIRTKNENDLPITQIPPFQISIAGGFFILHKQMINWWFYTFDKKLFKYFLNGYLVKDDQIIVADCVFNNLSYFTLFRETNQPYDNWFMFQRIFN